MSRIPLPLAVDDITAFARCLRTRLTASQAAPSHLELLNWLAKAAGYKNFQHFRATVRPNLPEAASAPLAAPEPAPAPDPVVASEPTPEPISETRLKRLARLYDAAGRLTRWPSKRGMQLTCLWTVWAAIPSRTDLETNYYGDLPRIIVSLLEEPPDVRAWRLEPNSYAELPWRASPPTADVEPPATAS